MPRHPHLGHAALFVLITGSVFVLTAAVILGTHLPQILILAITYILTLALAWFLFPLLWQTPLLTGLQWNANAVSPRLLLLGPALAVVTQFVQSRLNPPKDLPIDDMLAKLLQNSALVWLVAFFAIVLAPLFEEVVFRGFFLPALALATDYLRLPKDLAALHHWRTQSTFTPLALTLSTVITSVLFALLHAVQLAFYWPAVALIFLVSLVLCAVRLRTQSLAASVLVHTTYNATIFLTLLAATHRAVKS